MAQNIALFRGGTPVFRPAFCCGDYPEYSMPVDAPHLAGTPPFDSHADGERGQGYLNLSYPFVPNQPDAAQVTQPFALSEDERVVIGGIVWGSHLKGESSLNTIVHEIGHSFGLTDLFIADNDFSYPYNYVMAKKIGKVFILTKFIIAFG